MKLFVRTTLMALCFAASAQAFEIAPFPTGSIGVYRSGTWHLDMDGDHAWSFRDDSHVLGSPGDKPIVFSSAPAGCSTTPQFAEIGTVRNPSSWFTSRNNLDWDAADVANTFLFGTNPLPAVWNGAAVAFEDGTFHVDWNGNRIWETGDVSLPFGLAGDIPVIGQWTDTDQQRIGVYRRGTWFVDFNGSNGWEAKGDRTYRFGDPDDLPVVIPSTFGADHIAVFRNGEWFVDANRNGQWDGNAGGDLTWVFGQAGDIPVVSRGGWVNTNPCPNIR